MRLSLRPSLIASKAALIILFLIIFANELFLSGKGNAFEWDYWGAIAGEKVDTSGNGAADNYPIDLYRVNSATKEKRLIQRFCADGHDGASVACPGETGWYLWTTPDKSLNDPAYKVDDSTIILKVRDGSSSDFKKYKFSYDESTNSLTKGEEVTIDDSEENPSNWYDPYTFYGRRVSGSQQTGTEHHIGGLILEESGVSTADGNLIRKNSRGEVHIGRNSLVLRESGGRQQMWATGANGNSIDIDITNGSRLLINGRDVEKSIDNVGALSAALGSVPAISADSQFTCGFGAGTHSSAYALSGGCASRVSDRVSVTAALATVINNHTGDSDDNLSARAGFTFRLGKIDDSPKVAARKAAELHDKVAKLEERNESLIALLQAQASRLERLEQLASGLLSPLGDRASSD